MAQKRMVDKRISVSDQVANLSLPAQLIFTWSIPHADDVGLLPESIRTLKGTICPLVEISTEDFGMCVTEIVNEGLWSIFEFNSKRFYRLNAFGNHQTLKKDRQPQTILPITSFKDSKETWKLLEDIGFQMETEEKRREEKRSKDIEETATPSIPVFERKIRDKDEEYKDLVKDLQSHDYLTAVKIHDIVLKEFLPYWREKGESAKKERWEKEKAFDYQRRIRTWIKNFHRNDYFCKAEKWHRKGDSCHCVKEAPEIDYKSLPTSSFAKELGLSKKV